MLWTGQIGSGRIGCGELKREARRGSLAQDGGNARRRPRWCSKGRRERAWGVHVAWRR